MSFMKSNGDDKDDDETGAESAEIQAFNQTGPYFLRSLIDNVPLSSDETGQDVEITCVELYEANLYVGTSQAEVLHFVLLSEDASKEGSEPEFMLASRSELQHTTSAPSGQTRPGVQQILLLNKVSKACILCNGTVVFYTLPELSPAFGYNPIRNCAWVGGLDLGQNEELSPEQSELFLLSRRSRINVVRIGNDPRPTVRNIEYPGSLISVRRGSFACVANSRSYALLDIDHQQKIPLFPISSLESASAETVGGEAEDIRLSHTAGLKPNHSIPSEGSSRRNGNNQGHGRTTSLGALVGGLTQRNQSPRPQSEGQSGREPVSHLQEPSEPILEPHSGNDSTESEPLPKNSSREKPLPLTPGDTWPSSLVYASQSNPASIPLRPHIVSPKPTEFLLVTGTTIMDPGVGIFVNLDGDVCRGTIEFEKYPEDVVLDCQNHASNQTPKLIEGNSEDYVLAVIQGGHHGETAGVEIQPLNPDTGSNQPPKAWMAVPSRSTAASAEPSPSSYSALGVRRVNSVVSVFVESLSALLQLVRLRLPSDGSGEGDQATSQAAHLENASDNVALHSARSSVAYGKHEADSQEDVARDARDATRVREEQRFARRFGSQPSGLMAWRGSSIWLIVRNPFAIRLDARLDSMAPSTSNVGSIDRRQILDLLSNMRGEEPKTETHFLSLGYIRQKASLLLFANFINSSVRVEKKMDAAEIQVIEDSLLEGAVDPRVVMTMVPFLHQDISESNKGIWVHGGVQALVESYLPTAHQQSDVQLAPGEVNLELIKLLRRYLSEWRRKKGFGSVADEQHVFESIDAGLLHTLLELDRGRSMGRTAASSTRVELYALVDQGIDCFDRAVSLLEQYQRLYVLSRLYHSRKLTTQVLSTWTRIIDHDVDGGEFTDGENEIRRYLAKSENVADVARYGAWLARRNPAMGVRVFTEVKSRVRFQPHRVIEILKSQTPEALRIYLEHLVFGQGESYYVKDLINFYLDRVLGVLETSARARDILVRSYESYRALRPPRPTYREFIIENALDEGWWDDRLRLLQLLGGSHGVAGAYDVTHALTRLEPFEKELVPEMIILDGKQSRHQSALRLLTHDLGDYDSGINYCLLGGAGIFHPTFGVKPADSTPSHDEQVALFHHLLLEFVRIEDESDRIEQTSRLLERFGRWYDVPTVFGLIPKEWSLELVAGFVVGTLRRMQAELSETTILKALCGTENLQVWGQYIDRCAELGPTIDAVD